MPDITLLTKKGEVHKTAGLNWGSNNKNHTRPVDAYIPIHISTIRKYPTVFSPKKPTQTIINFHWDDGTIMKGLFEGNILDNVSGNMYPKQISSYPNKDIMGKYFRKRLGLPVNSFVTLKDLARHGRDTVTILKIDDDNYSLDFHV